MKKGLTEIVFILDRSGSMAGLEKDTIGGFNAMLEKQRRGEGQALISTVLFSNESVVIHDRVDAISHATCGMAIDIGAKVIVVTSMSGMTVRMVSRFRAPTDIVGMATNKRVWYKLSLSWGVLPVLSEQFNSTDVLFYHALRAARDTMHLQPGDNVVMTGGITNGKSGNTNLIKIEAV